MSYAALSRSALYVTRRGSLSYDPADAQWFDNVGDAWAKGISHGWEPWAKDSDGEYHRPDTEALAELAKGLGYSRNWELEIGSSSDNLAAIKAWGAP